MDFRCRPRLLAPVTPACTGDSSPSPLRADDFCSQKTTMRSASPLFKPLAGLPLASLILVSFGTQARAQEADELDPAMAPYFIFATMLFAVVGALILTCTAATKRAWKSEVQHLEDNGTTAKAKVANARTQTSSGGEHGGTSTTFYATLSFTAVSHDGAASIVTKEIQVKSDFYSAQPVGSEADVTYDPVQPKRMMLGAKGHLVGEATGGCILGCMGATFLIMGVGISAILVATAVDTALAAGILAGCVVVCLPAASALGCWFGRRAPARMAADGVLRAATTSELV
jgi:hypothetical protein